MKNKRLLSCLSLILVLVFILLQASVLTACKKEKENEENPSTEETGPGAEEITPPDETDNERLEWEKQLSYVDTQGKVIINANYCDDFEKKTEPAFFYLTKEDENAPMASVGFIWNSEEIMAIVAFDSADKVVISLPGYEKELSSSDFEEGFAYCTISFTDTDVLPRDLGQLIAAKVTVEKDGKIALFDGFAQLTDYSVCFSNTGNSIDDFDTATAIVSGVKPDIAVAGIKSEDGAIKLYDTYGDGKGKPLTRLNLTKKNLKLTVGKNYVFESDITINSMPVYQSSFVSVGSAYGLSFNLTSDVASKAQFFSLINTDEGITFVAIGEDSSHTYTASIGKNVGDTFHLSVVMLANGNMVLSVDGYEIKTFENTSAVRGNFASGSVNIVWQRNQDDFTSAAQDLNVEIDSMSVYYDQSKSVTDNIKISHLFGDADPIKLEGDEIYLAPEKLVLAAEASSKKYNLSSEIHWFSSNVKVIGDDGAVTSPSESGEFVTLKLYILDGNTIVTKKEFYFFAKGENPSENVGYVKGDNDPFTGTFETRDTVFVLNKAMNSIVYDMGEVTDINRVTINSTSMTGLVNKNLISVYYSDDNETYKYLDSFSMLQTGSDIYFYNFEVNARYIKVHTTINGLPETGKVVNSLQKMMYAEYTDEPLLASDSFKYNTTTTVKNNNDSVVYDKIFKLTLDDMGIDASDLKSDLSDIRFVCDGNYLPHYNVGETFYIRVLEMDAEEGLEVKVLYGNESAESVSDGNETFEVQYGTKYAKENNESGWFNTILTAPNNDLLRIVSVKIGDLVGFGVYRSTNGGLSWSGLKPVQGSEIVSQDGGTCECGGSIVDKENGKIFFICQRIDMDTPIGQVGMNYIFLSEDNGETWEFVGNPQGNNRPAPQYSLSYSDGITLSCEDGTGPNVDYVFTLGVEANLQTSAFNTTSFYSKDGGKTWLFSDTTFNYNYGNPNTFEGGCSEEALIEQEDGTLVCYARCQIDGILHFAMSKSYDHGVTWEKPTLLTNIYTSNTQPIVERMSDGTPVFLWGGNNSLGALTYQRFPLNMAYSDDDGETFKWTLDASFQTIINTADRLEGRSLHTNPDLTFVTYHGTEVTYIVSTRHQMYIIGVDDYLYKTKGAFDSFESGILAEGWLFARGGAVATSVGATDGNMAMKIAANTTATRSVPYMEAGTVSFDYYVDSFGELATIELQAAYNDATGVTAPVQIVVEKDGKVNYYDNNRNKKSTGLTLNKGDNTITIDFDGAAKTATLTINGVEKDIAFVGNDGYVCHFNIFTKARTVVALDRFIAVREA